MNLYIKSNFKNIINKLLLTPTFFNFKNVYNVHHQLTNTNLKIMFNKKLNTTFLNLKLIDNITCNKNKFNFIFIGILL